MGKLEDSLLSLVASDKASSERIPPLAIRYVSTITNRGILKLRTRR